MPKKYTAPEFERSAFNGPHYSAYAAQEWKLLCHYTLNPDIKANNFIYNFDAHFLKKYYFSERYYITGNQMKEIMETLRRLICDDIYTNFKPLEIYSCYCSHCKKYSYWHEGKMIYPAANSAPMPHEDMPEECKTIYFEACAVADTAPRAAAALLRLCAQKLLPHLGGQGNTINADIAALVKERKIPAEIQQALDICRVIGNHAVHPGQIALEEEPQRVSVLFDCLNLIVEKAVSEPKQMKAFYESLPQKDRENIAKRDSRA